MARCTNSVCRRWRPDVLVALARRGMRVDGAWFCSPACVHTATRQRLLAGTPPPLGLRSIPKLRLGVLLVHQGTITQTQLAHGLASQQASGRRIGAELKALGLVDDESIVRGLAAQAGVSYLSAVDASCVRTGPGGLSRDEVRALGVVPIRLVEADRLLMVACRAPIPRAALSAIRQLTGWTTEPFLVSDADWQALMEGYGSVASGPVRRAVMAQVPDVDAAAAAVAEAAARAGAVTVTQAFCESSTWLRVEALDATNTVFVAREEAEPWPAATTSH
jgi:hypothetical protein